MVTKCGPSQAPRWSATPRPNRCTSFPDRDITERKRAEAAIQALSVVDELTGLYNRRGFLAFSEQHLGSIQRTNKSLMVVYADLDGLKQITTRSVTWKATGR